MLLSLIVNEMKQTNGMYYAYPKGYNQKVADTNNRLYAESVRRIFEDAYGVTLKGAQILVDSGVARERCHARISAQYRNWSAIGAVKSMWGMHLKASVG